METNQKVHQLTDSWIECLAARPRNIDPEQDPDLEIPIRALVPITSFCALYCFGRGFILAEDLVGLRLLPASAFETVPWSKYVHHWYPIGSLLFYLLNMADECNSGILCYRYI
jgi:hypothetical protein